MNGWSTSEFLDAARQLSHAGVTCHYVPQAGHWLLGKVGRADQATFLRAKLGPAVFAEELKAGTILEKFNALKDEVQCWAGDDQLICENEHPNWRNI
jgi:hypothetical protein